MSTTTVLPPEPAPPTMIHNCPSCSHWLPDGTLVCPECQTLTYGQHLNTLAGTAQALERESKWPEARDRWRSMLAWLPAETSQAASIRQHIQQIDDRLKAEDDKKARWTKRLGPLAPVVFFLLKAKSALFLLLKLKFLLSMFLFFGLYWALFGWKFAAGFTAGILLHETGHYIAARRRGLKADLPIFLPGFGAYVRWYHQGVTLQTLAAIALAGPLAGLGAAVLCLGGFYATHYVLFLVLANVTAWYNLLNLTPVFGLDGAQATYALSRMQRVMIAVTSLLFFGLSVAGSTPFHDGTQWVFLFVGLGMTWRCFTNDAPEQPETRTMIVFLALLLLLGFLLFLTRVPGM